MKYTIDEMKREWRQWRNQTGTWDSIKWANAWVAWVLKGLENVTGVESLLKEIKGNFPNLGKYTNIQVQEGQISSVKFNSN